LSLLCIDLTTGKYYS